MQLSGISPKNSSFNLCFPDLCWLLILLSNTLTYQLCIIYKLNILVMSSRSGRWYTWTVSQNDSWKPYNSYFCICFFLCTLKEALFSWMAFFPKYLSSNYLKPSIFVNSYCSIPVVCEESSALRMKRTDCVFVSGKAQATA